MTTTVGLKPCPYCQQKPAMVRNDLAFRMTCWHVACQNRECINKPSTWYYYHQKDAIDEWNKEVCG